MTQPFPAHRETGSLLLTAAVVLSLWCCRPCVLSVLYKYNDQMQPAEKWGVLVYTTNHSPSPKEVMAGTPSRSHSGGLLLSPGSCSALV